MLHALTVTGKEEHPLLAALANLVLAVNCVVLGYDSIAKSSFMEGFEVLSADRLLAPRAREYRGLMGLPWACLRNGEEATLRKIHPGPCGPLRLSGAALERDGGRTSINQASF